MVVTLKWHGDEFMAWTESQVQAGLDAVRVELQRIARLKAGRPNTGKRIKITRPRSGGNKRSRTEYPNSSRPGESPRRRTGFGQKNIVSGISGMTARVGYTRAARYMTFHELGINYKKRGLEQRPTIVPALRDNRTRLVMLFRRAATRK